MGLCCGINKKKTLVNIDYLTIFTATKSKQVFVHQLSVTFSNLTQTPNIRKVFTKLCMQIDILASILHYYFVFQTLDSFQIFMAETLFFRNSETLQFFLKRS
jgi:hypothetical protein